MRFAPGIEGMAKRWCKWSYDAAVVPHFPALSDQEAILVGKGGLQRHFLLEPTAQELAKRDFTRHGFSLELTRLRRGGADHWALLSRRRLTNPCYSPTF
jgi:hypothetical protein